MNAQTPVVQSLTMSIASAATRQVVHNQTIDVTSSSPGCSAAQAQTVCVVTVTLQAGSVSYTHLDVYKRQMFKRVVVPLDGSECADKAFGVAVDLAKLHGSQIAACSIVDPVLVVGSTPVSYTHLRSGLRAAFFLRQYDGRGGNGVWHFL